MTTDLENRLRHALEDATRSVSGSPDLGRTVTARAAALARRRARAQAFAAAGLVVAMVGGIVVATRDDARSRIRTVTVPTTEVGPAPEVTDVPTTTRVPTPTTTEAAPGRPGALDQSFGQGGRAVVTFRDGAGPQHAAVTALAVDGEGRVVSAGRMESANGSEVSGQRVALTRHLPDGRLDPTFGLGGSVVTDVTVGQLGPGGLFVLPDGKLLVTGTRSAGQDEVFLARLLPDGRPDTTFGDAGVRTIACRPACRGGGRTLRDGDAFLLATGGALTEEGETGQLALYRFDAEGRLDAGYGDGGLARPGKGDAASLAIDGERRAVVVGRDQGTGFVARVTRTGARDLSFGTGGRVGLALGGEMTNLLAVAVQPDGRIVAAGSHTGEGEPAEIVLLRLLPDGARDGAFADGGTVVTPRPSMPTYLLAALVDPAGNVVVAGVDRSEMMVARYDGAGRPDTRFGHGGFVTVGFGRGSDGAYELLRLPDGRLIGAGYAAGGDGRYGFALARLYG